jgi:hypothetical protein
MERADAIVVQVVCGGLSSEPERAQAAAAEIGLDSARSYATYTETFVAERNRSRSDGMEVVAIDAAAIRAVFNDVAPAVPRSRRQGAGVRPEHRGIRRRHGRPHRRMNEAMSLEQLAIGSTFTDHSR